MFCSCLVPAVLPVAIYRTSRSVPEDGTYFRTLPPGSHQQNRIQGCKPSMVNPLETRDARDETLGGEALKRVSIILDFSSDLQRIAPRLLPQEAMAKRWP